MESHGCEFASSWVPCGVVLVSIRDHFVLVVGEVETILASLCSHFEINAGVTLVSGYNNLGSLRDQFGPDFK